MDVYCGNNLLLNPEKKVFRYECLKKGIGIGINKKVNNNYIQMNQPRKYYCGKNIMLPNGYIDFGTNTECLIKGVGIGMSMSSKISKTRNIDEMMILFLIFIYIYAAYG